MIIFKFGEKRPMFRMLLFNYHFEVKLQGSVKLSSVSLELFLS